MIYISNTNSTKKILVENSLKDISDISLLKNTLLSDSAHCFEITFIDVEFVSLEIIKLLHNIKKYILLTSTKRSLWLYFTKLGFKCNYKNTLMENNLSLEPIQALTIGGSAGSIERLITIVKNLAFCDISIFVVVHVLPDKISKLDTILQNYTKFKVFNAKNNMKIEKGIIYIAPPDYHMIVSNNTIYLNQEDKVNFSRPSIDITFKSLASNYLNTLLAILLCGYGRDGSGSLEVLKNYNSQIIIEDPSECEAKDMPQNAIKTNNYTKVLNIKQIELFLESTFNTNIDLSLEIDKFLENIYFIYGYDFRNYDKKSLTRRIELTMQSLNIKEFVKFERLILQSEKAFSKLVKAFSINVTEYFRNPLTFKSLRDDVLPYLKTYPYIRIWCAGCSKGDEPYSIAILLDELGLLEKSQIYATDFNDIILQEAENGIFPKNLYDDYKSNYNLSGGEKNFDDWFIFNEDFVEIKHHIKNKILFFKHNLVTDSSINEFNLILCRNVLLLHHQII